jgi:hypothetical protein
MDCGLIVPTWPFGNPEFHLLTMNGAGVLGA